MTQKWNNIKQITYLVAFFFQIYSIVFQFVKFAAAIWLPMSVFINSFDIRVSPPLARSAPHIPYVPYVKIEWSARLSSAKSVTKFKKTNTMEKSGYLYPFNFPWNISLDWCISVDPTWSMGFYAITFCYWKNHSVIPLLVDMP